MPSISNDFLVKSEFSMSLMKEEVLASAMKPHLLPRSFSILSPSGLSLPMICYTWADEPASTERRSDAIRSLSANY